MRLNLSSPNFLARARACAATSLLLAGSAFALVTRGSTFEASLDAVSPEHIKKDIFYVASDEMAGRDTPSEGQRTVARYIRDRLTKLKFEPGAPKGFLFEYPLFLPRLDDKGTHLTLERGANPVELAFGSDYFFTARRLASADRSGAIAFCGKGADNDFGANVSGAWAMVLDVNQGSLAIENNARKAGALGIVFVPAASYTGKPYAERFSHDVTITKTAPVRWPAKKDASKPDASKPDDAKADPAKDKDKDKDKDLPVVYLTREAAQRLCDLAALESASDGSAKPAIAGTLHDVRKLVGDEGTVQAENVCGFWRGSDPTLSKEVIIVSAHYDHVGVDSKGQIYNGADDNGSGTTGLMAMAEALATRGPLRRSVMLMWVSGEEKGLFGSQAWTEHPWLPEGCKPICDINIDMIGRNAPDKLLITPTSARKEYNGLVKLAEANGPLEGFPTLGSCDAYWNRSDHANFAANLKIPVTFLFSDVHEDYHQPTDDPEKIDCDKIRRVVRLVLRMIEGLQADKLDL